MKRDWSKPHIMTRDCPDCRAILDDPELAAELQRPAERKTVQSGRDVQPRATRT